MNAAQIQLAAPEMWQLLDVKELIRARRPQIRQAGFGHAIEESFQFVRRYRVQHHEPLALLAIRNTGHDELLLGRAGKFLKLLLDFDVWHHLAANFAESAQPVGDCEEAVFIFRRDISRDVPAILQHFRRFFRLAEIALHHIRSAHQ